MNFTNNNRPDWAPAKPLIVSDPSKLSYFAKANMIRGGMGAVAAAVSAEAFSGLSGLGTIDGWTSGQASLGNAVQTRIQQLSPATGGPLPDATASDVTRGGQPLSSWLEGFGSFVKGVIGGNNPAATAPVPTVSMENRADDTILGLPKTAVYVAGGLAAAVVIYKLVK